MEETGPFDRKARRQRRRRSASLAADARYIRTIIAEELLERLDTVQRSFGEALVIGGGNPDLVQGLAERGIRAAVADCSFAWARLHEGVQCDEDRLPFADGAFDLVVSPEGLDSVNDLPGALTLVRRSLRPDGLFLAAMAGGGSLPRLKSAMLAADMAVGRGAAARVHPQIDVRAAGDLLMRAGLALPVVDTHGFDVRFASVAGLFRDLRALGATNVLSRRAPLARQAVAAAAAAFADVADPDGKTAERFEILYMTAWAPSPDQPKPARPGSAVQSLSEVLGRPKARPDEG